MLSRLRRLVRARRRKTSHLVATWSVPIDWHYLGSSFGVEMMTFFLFVDRDGRRWWDVYEYGRCAARREHRRHLGEVLAWIYGGPIPPGAEPARPKKHEPRLRIVSQKG